MNKKCICGKVFNFPIEKYLKDVELKSKKKIIENFRDINLKCEDCINKNYYEIFNKMKIFALDYESLRYECTCGWIGERPNLRSGILTCVVCNKRVKKVKKCV